jgi:hypothetical protein
MVPNATPHTVPNAKPIVQGQTVAPISTTGTVNGGSKTTHTAQGQSHIPKKVDASSKTKTSSPGFFEKVRNYFKGDQEKVIEPGIRNKEVEAYRTNDAKEVEYNDAIIQDDKDISLPTEHSKKQD